jgi:phosphoribosylformylglycinamidine synthase
MLTMDFKTEGNLVYVIGKTDGHLDQSIFARELLNEKKGPPPTVNLFNEKNIGETVLDLSRKNLIVSCHDVSLGGILTALSLKGLTNKYEYFFGEDQARYIVEIPKASLKKVNDILNKYSVHFDELGTVNGQSIVYKDDINLPIEELADAHKYWLKKYMDS